MITETVKKDLSDIDNLQDLKSEINKLQSSIKIQEQHLAARLHRLPSESIKATVGAVVPSVVSNLVSGKSFGLVTAVLGFMLGKKNLKTQQ